LALDLIEFNPEFQKAMEFVFGNTFVCNTSEIARKLAYNEKFKVRCVNLDGDEFDPSGIMRGGAVNKSESILKKVDDLNIIQNKIKSIKNNIINNKNKTIKDEKKMKEYEERTDNELNFMTYFEALIKDRRTFLQIYFSLIKTKNIIIFAFGCKNDFNPRTMKICFVFYIFSIFLVSNTLFITDTTLHDLFMSNGKSEIISDIQKIVYIIIISGTIKNILLIILFPESDILNIRKKSSQLTFQSGLRIQKSISMAIMRCYYYFFISIITLFIFWVYIACFFMIFQNTQLYALINTLISFGISLVIPFILYFIPACLRKSSLESKGSQNSYFLYSISKILQVIF
jgi:hypothetical protein